MTNVSFLGEWQILGIKVEGLNLEKNTKKRLPQKRQPPLGG